MKVLNDSRWLSRPLDLLYVSTCGIQNFVRRGKEVTLAMNGELVQRTSPSKLVDTRPLMAFVVISIFSFIICISWAIRIALTSILEGQLVSSGSSLMLEMLLFLVFPFLPGPSWVDDYHFVRQHSAYRIGLPSVARFSSLVVVPTLCCVGWVILLLQLGFALRSRFHFAWYARCFLIQTFVGNKAMLDTVASCSASRPFPRLLEFCPSSINVVSSLSIPSLLGPSSVNVGLTDLWVSLVRLYDVSGLW